MSSAFSFINNKKPQRKTHSLSSSLIDEIYDSKDFSSFVNQSSPSKQQSHSLYEKGSSKSFQKSAFNFISPEKTSRNAPLQAGPSLRQKKSMWTLVQKKRKALMSQLSDLYTKQHQIDQRLQQVKEKMAQVMQEKQKALRDESFSFARDLQTQENQCRKELGETKRLQHQIHDLWNKLAEVIMEEAERAQDLVDVFEEEKKNKQRECDHYAKNMNQRDEKLLEQIRVRREEIHNQKSEIVLDVELWKRNDAELQEKMYEMVMDDIEEKKDLEEKTMLVQDEINALLEKVSILEEEKKVYKMQIDKLEEVMENKLKPVTDKKMAHEQELEYIKQRQNDIDKNSDILDEEDIKVNTEMKHHSEEKARGLNEIEKLDRDIAFIINRKLYGKEESKDILNVLQKQIKARDYAMESERMRLKESKNNIHDIIKQVDTIQLNEYEHEQRQMQLDYTILQLSAKLKNLQRQKQLASDTDQYEKAMLICDQIDLAEQQLDKIEREKDSLNHSDLQKRLHEKKDELEQKKREYKALEIEIEKNIASILSNSHKDLENILLSLKNNRQNDSVPVLEDLIKHELTSIEAQTNVVNNRQEGNLMFF